LNPTKVTPRKNSISTPFPSVTNLRQLWLVSFALFLSMVGFGLTLPALPFFIERLALAPDATTATVTFHVGMLTSAYALSQVALGPTIGVWSDRWGRRPVIIVGLLGFAATQALFGLGTSLPILYAARLAGGVSAAALLTASSALVADLFDGDQRVRGLAWSGTAASLGVVVGAAMTGFLSRGDMHGHQMIGGFMLDGFSIPFLAAAGLAVLAVPPIFFWLEEKDSEGVPSATEAQSSSSLRDVLVLSAVAQFALASFEAVFTLFGRDILSLSLTEIGWGFVICGLVMAVFQGGMVGIFGNRISMQTQLTAGFGFLGGGLLFLSFASTTATALGAIAVLSLGIAIVTPNLTTVIAARRPHALGSAMGMQNTANGVGQVVGPVVGALLFAWDTRLPFVLGAGLAIWVAIWLIVKGTDTLVRPTP
jgi:MFS family permease